MDDENNLLNEIFSLKEKLIFPDQDFLNIKYREIIIPIPKVNAERKSKVDDNTAKMQSIKWLGV